MIRYRPLGNPNPPAAMAGWLFADLMLLLFIVGLGAQATAYPRPSPPIPVEPSVSLTPTPEPPAPPIERPVGLAKDPVWIELVISFDAVVQGEAGAVNNMQQTVANRLGDLGIAHARAGMVIIWTKDERIEHAERVSTAVGNALPGASQSFFGGAVMRPYWLGGGFNSGAVILEIFLLT